MRRVLIADDDQSFLESLVEGLNDLEGYEILTATNGKKALAIIQETNLDLIITDLKMPEMSGFELVAYLGRHYRQIPIIVMTAFGTEEMEENFRLLGVSSYLEKPLDINMLSEKIQKIFSDPGSNAATFISRSQSNLLKVLYEASESVTGGEVIVRAGNQSGRAFVNRGNIVWVVASSLRQTLVTQLTDRAGLDLAELQAVFTECKKLGSNFGDTLIEWGLINREPLREILLDHIAQSLITIFSWPQSEVLFIPDQRKYTGSLLFPLTEVLERARFIDSAGILMPIELTSVEQNNHMISASVSEELSEFQELSGFAGVAAFTPTASILTILAEDAGVITDLIGYANDIIIDAQRLSNAIGVGYATFVELTSGEGCLLTHCFNENQDALISDPGKGHLHFLLALRESGSLPYAKLRFERAMKRLAPLLKEPE